MPTQTDLLTSFIERLAEVIARRLNHAAPTGRQAKAAPSPGRKRAKGQKRAPRLIANTTAALLAHIKHNQGQRIEQIAAAMKIPTIDLKLPARKLLEDNAVKTKGQKRGTRYFAG